MAGTELPAKGRPAAVHLLSVVEPLLTGTPHNAPATARAAMSVTSSDTRRPLGNPATSPASTPIRLREAAAVAGIDVFRRSRSATGPAGLVEGIVGPAY